MHLIIVALTSSHGHDYRKECIWGMGSIAASVLRQEEFLHQVLYCNWRPPRDAYIHLVDISLQVARDIKAILRSSGVKVLHINWKEL